MVEEFTLRFKAQEEWGWLAILDFFLAGGGAGLFLIGLFLEVNLALLFGLGATVLGALALLLDLGHPERFWRAISRPGSSWISRGVILVTVYVVCGTIYAASRAAGLPWATDSTLYGVVGAIAAIAAVGVMAYTGFVLVDSPGIPAWQSALLPVQFIVFSLLTGAGGLYLLLPVLGDAGRLQALAWVGIGLACGGLVVLAAYLVGLYSSTSAAQQAARDLIQGRLALHFLGVVVLLGLVVPLIILGYLIVARAQLTAAAPALMVTGALFIVGGLLFRYSLIKAGCYEPVWQRGLF
ncbi:MAG: polysulfide reductase NrfD [Chloroflexi bacterium]|nr:polysulfide reductase NrfD [Chloroflexota bacterium]